MSGAIYSYSDSDYEMVDPLQASLNRTPNISVNSATSVREPERREPVPSPPPSRPASMAGAQPRYSNGEKSENSSIQMEDIHITRPYQTSSPRSQPDKANITQSQPTEARSVRKEPLGKEERKKAELKNKVKAADERHGDSDDYEKSFMQRHRRPIMLVIFLLLIALAIALGIGARNASMVSIAGAFTSSKGKECIRQCENTDRYPTPPLVVIALNGFHQDFLNHQLLVSNIARLSECGVHGYTIPSFPSTAVPNLYSIVTGIYPAFHGKAADWLRAYRLNETEFGPAGHPNTYSRMDPAWFQVNGLWGIAADQGILTASHSWIGREGNIVEERSPSPSYYQTYDSGVSYRDRIQTVLNWLHLGTQERPQFITVYFEDPGVTAEKYGFDSKQTMDSLARVDSAIGLLLDSLVEESNLGCINVMVVSTGGLAKRSCDRVYYLSDDLQNLDDYQLLPDSVTSVGGITATDRARPEMDTSEEILEHLQCKVDHGQVFTKRLLPVQLHASYGLQCEDAVILMEDRWTFAKQQEGYDRSHCKGLSDGFNPYSYDMKGVFVGFGKSFKTGWTVVPTVKNVDLYHLMAELINVTPRENNGTAGLLKDALITPKVQETVAMEFSSPQNAECSYPINDNEYTRRHQESATGCVCTQATLNSYSETNGIVLKDKDNNIRQTNAASSRQRNAPFGFPKILRDIGPAGQDYCELYQSNFITAYENKLQIPLFATFTIQRNSVTVTQINNCLRYDVRLQPEKSPKCSNYDRNMNPRLPVNIMQGLLYDPSLADSVDNELNALTSANIVPQYQAFQQNVWLPLAVKIRQWANHGNRSADMNVLSGPAYDWNSDTLRDTYHDIAASQAWVVNTPVPSHYFLVATRCTEDISLTLCSLQSLEVASFVLPHTNDVRICQTFDDYLSTHMTSIQDVELITGLQLYPDFNNDEDLRDELLRFKTRMPNLTPWMV